MQAGTKEAPSFPAEKVEEFAKNSVQSVFSMMLSTDASFKGEAQFPGSETEQPLKKPLNTDQEMVASSISFVGKINGAVYLYFREDLSVRITSQMLGMTEEEVREEGNEIVDDCLGEIANMVVGDFKNKLCEEGYDCALSVPSLLRGKELQVKTVSSSNTIRKFFEFEALDSSLIYDFLLQLD